MTIRQQSAARTCERRRAALLCSTALVAASLALTPRAALAQEIVDGGAHEIVDGAGLGAGAPPSTRPSPWAIGGDLTIGDAATGLLTIRNSGAVTNTDGYIGVNPGSTGSATVTGSGSTWINSGSLNVGLVGAGHLQIADFGVVTDVNGTLAGWLNSTGSATVTGAGSEWRNSELLIVGGWGTGVLLIADGATATSESGRIGLGDTSIGQATVTGAGSNWTNSSSLVVGFLGNGSLTIADDGAVTNTHGYIGEYAGGTGEVTVTGAGSEWMNTSSLSVGFDGTGALTVADGGAVLSVFGTIGYGAGSTGSATVTGANSLWANGPEFVVGLSGSGALEIADGGEVTNWHSYVGVFAGSTGEVTVTGAGSVWVNSGDLVVGREGAGALTIADGGAVFNGQGSIGSNAGGTGEVTVTGAGSAWSSAGLLVGNSGSGALTVADGGAVSASQGWIGYNTGSTGEVTVTGPGAALTNSGSLEVGRDGSGALTITDGGAVSNTDSSIGSGAGSTGDATVSGSGSSWTSSFLTVGGSGSGTLTIADGGAVSSTLVYIGMVGSGAGEATVAGAGSSWTGSVLTVGGSGRGTLAIADGGAVSGAQGRIGANAGGTGEVTVTGAGSTWTNSNQVLIGWLGSGALTIADGGVVSATGVHVALAGASSGALNFGAAAGDAAIAAGSLDAPWIAFSAGTGSIVFNHTSDDFALAADISGMGQIHALAGTTLLTGDSSGFSGTTSVLGGQLLVNGALGGQVTVGASGLIGGSGQIVDLILGAGGTVAPGNSIGTLNIAGDITITAGSVYEVEVDPTGTASDLIAVTGTATINGGTVQHVGLIGDYGPTSTYTILTAAGGVTGTFDAVASDFAFLDAALGYTAQTVTLTLNRNDISFAGVGETFNQQSTADAVEPGGWGAPLFDAVVGLSADNARIAFDMLSGELHGSVRSAMVEDSGQARGMLAQRLRQFDPDQRGVRMWAQAHGAVGHMGTDGNAASLRSRTGGLWLGAEGVAQDLVLGAAIGADLSTHDSVRAGQAERDGYRLAAYASGHWGALGLSGGVAAAWDDLETERTALFPGFSEQLEADYSAQTLQAFAEATWTIPAGQGVIEPFASVARVRTETDGFTETGGAGALTVGDQTQEVTFATLGLGARRGFDDGRGRTASLEGRLGWRHASGDLTPATDQAFAGGVPFTVNGLPVDADALVAEIGGRLDLGETLALKVDWTGQAGDHTAQRLSASLSWRF